MIKKSLLMKNEVKYNEQNGIGVTEINHILHSDEVHGSMKLFAKIKLAQGCSIGYHRHLGEEEIYYITSGKGVVVEDGVEVIVVEGDAHKLASGSSHSIMNISVGTLEFIAIILPIKEVLT